LGTDGATGFVLAAVVVVGVVAGVVAALGAAGFFLPPLVTPMMMSRMRTAAGIQ
jgi:hypothetical protein